jgi:hypothetical protein
VNELIVKKKKKKENKRERGNRGNQNVTEAITEQEKPYLENK